MNETHPTTPRAREADDVDQRVGTTIPQSKVRKPRSNRALAAAAGISERHFYRLRKQANVPTSEGGGRLYQTMVGPLLVAELLAELGHTELLGTRAHLYIDKYMAAFAFHLSQLQRELPDAIETRLADRTAKRSVDELRCWWKAQTQET